MTRKRVMFLLSKDPQTEHGGDIALSRLVIEIARESYAVQAVCLSGEPDVPAPGGSLIRVRKPSITPASLAWNSAISRRSLVHTRFDVRALAPAIESVDSDVIWAEHSYMAETYLRCRPASDRPRFVINTINSESLVWRALRGRVLGLDARRIIADEIRVAKQADAVGTYDHDESVMYRNVGVQEAHWIEITLPPQRRVDLSESGPRLIFMGTRDWPPNAEALELLLKWWPRIAHGIPDAELCVIGGRKQGENKALPAGVRDLGFVADLDEFLATGRALAAPVQVGGGVRVKILDAASRGLGVIGTSRALGSHGRMLGLRAIDDPAQFIEECRRMLLDREAAQQLGADLYERNSALWRARRPHAAIDRLIVGVQGEPAAPHQ